MLATITVQSLRNHTEREVGGMLYFNPNNHGIMQILEGSEGELETLFEKISRDPRHSALRVLSRENVSTHRFPYFGLNTGLITEKNLIVEAERIDFKDEHVYMEKFWDFINAHKLIQIIYSSKLVCTSSVAADEVMEAILCVAIPNNRKHNISGCLYFNSENNQVVQVIEGPSAVVCELYTKIQWDERHTDVSLLSKERLNARRFSEWGVLKDFLKVSPEEWMKAFCAESDVRIESTCHESLCTSTGDQMVLDENRPSIRMPERQHRVDEGSVDVVHARRHTCECLLL